MKRELVAAFLQLLLGLYCCYASHHPPPLVYPNGGILKLLIGGTLPIAMPNGRIVVYGHNIQYQFNLPANASLFGETPKLRKRRAVSNEPEEDDDERGLFYRMVEHELERRGRPSKDCLKRSICESAETPLRDDGLLGEIFHVLLTPDYGDSSQQQRWRQRHREYIEAAEIGRNGLDCLEAFPDCPPGSGLLDHVSRVLFAQD